MSKKLTCYSDGINPFSGEIVIPHDILVERARLSDLFPYSKQDGDDFKSLIIEVSGCNGHEGAFTKRPYYNGKKLGVKVVWSLDSKCFSDSVTKIDLVVKGKYNFFEEYEIEFVKPGVGISILNTSVYQIDECEVAKIKFGYANSDLVKDVQNYTLKVLPPFSFGQNGLVREKLISLSSRNYDQEINVFYANNGSESVTLGHNDLSVTIASSAGGGIVELCKDKIEIKENPEHDLNIQVKSDPDDGRPFELGSEGRVMLSLAKGPEKSKEIELVDVKVEPAGYLDKESVGSKKATFVLNKALKKMPLEAVKMKFTVETNSTKSPKKELVFALVPANGVAPAGISEFRMLALRQQSLDIKIKSKDTMSIYEPNNKGKAKIVLENKSKEISNVEISFIRGGEYCALSSSHFDSIKKNNPIELELTCTMDQDKDYPFELAIDADYCPRMTHPGTFTRRTREYVKEASVKYVKGNAISFGDQSEWVQIGELEIAPKNPGDDQHKALDNEKICISDSAHYQFVLEDGSRVGELDVTKKCIVPIAWSRPSNIENLDQPLESSFVHSADCIGLSEQIRIEHELKAVKETPTLRLGYCKKKEEFVNWGGQDFEHEYKKDELKNASSSIFNLVLGNSAQTPYKDASIDITEIRIEPECISMADDLPESGTTIQNGGGSLKLPVKIDWQKFKESDNPINVSVTAVYNSLIDGESTKKRATMAMQIALKRNIVEGWYSLDLGTSGIVMAKRDGEDVNLVELTDATDSAQHCIETDRFIISSATILKDSESGECGTIQMCPTSADYKQKSKFVFVPMKFMVGQPDIPFLPFYLNQSDHLESYKFDSSTNESSESLKSLTAEKMEVYTYENIFNRVRESDIDSIERLILTYPNTYVPVQRETIKNLLEKRFQFNNISFVPESDAVVAYYIWKRLYSVGFKGDESILIYDMGAGTLDLSLVSIKRVENHFYTDIVNRIGIPLGGNYLDYLLYDALKDEFTEESSKKPAQLKSAIKSTLKPRLGQGSEDRNIKEILGDDVKPDSEMTVKKLLGNIAEYLRICTEDIMTVFLGSEWMKQVNTVVFTGRASQFTPLKDKFREMVKDKSIEIDESTIAIDELKYAVAKGAIDYLRVFESPKRYKFSITNRNQYQNFGIIVTLPTENAGVNEVYLELYNPQNRDWEKCQVKDGTRYDVYEVSLNDMDFSRTNYIQFIQTHLKEEEVNALLQNKEDSKWCFVSQLLKESTSVLDDDEICSVTVKMKVDENNKIKLYLNGHEFMEKSVAENVEKNKLFIRSAWPYNNQ